VARLWRCLRGFDVLGVRSKARDTNIGAGVACQEWNNRVDEGSFRGQIRFSHLQGVGLTPDLMASKFSFDHPSIFASKQTRSSK
jgi:hypothetical protein